MSSLTKELQTATEARESNQIGQAIKIYEQIIKAKVNPDSEVDIKAQEHAIYGLGSLY